MKKHSLIKRILSALTLLCVCGISFQTAEASEAVCVQEAENGTLLGNAKIVKQMFDTYVDGLQNDGDGVRVVLTAPEDGFYDLVVRVKCGTYKENYVEIDGKRVGIIAATAPLFMDTSLERIYLSKGDHIVSILKYWGWTAIDRLSLVPSDLIPDDVYDVSAKLSDKNASDNAKRLMSWLTDVYGKKVISGQYCDGGMNGNENRVINKVTGKYPAILGLDLIEYSPSRVENGSRSGSIQKAINYWNDGGIVTFCWHWNAPSEYITGTWYSAFYTDHTNIDLAKIMNGEDEKGMTLLLRDIDSIAEELKKLDEAGVPVLWRPLHEASGGWFWWGATGADAYIKLYRLMYDRLTSHHDLHNLIWVWNGQSADWYPGDDVVDIIGWDIYAGEHAYSSQSAVFLEALRVTDERKMIILSEIGTVPDIDLIFRDQTIWGSFATWSGDFVVKGKNLSEKYTEEEILIKMYSDERVIDRAEIPDLLSYPIKEN